MIIISLLNNNINMIFYYKLCLLPNRWPGVLEDAGSAIRTILAELERQTDIEIIAYRCHKDIGSISL